MSKFKPGVLTQYILNEYYIVVVPTLAF